MKHYVENELILKIKLLIIENRKISYKKRKENPEREIAQQLASSFSKSSKLIFNILLF